MKLQDAQRHHRSIPLIQNRLIPMPADLQLISIWNNFAKADGHICEAIATRRDDSKQDIRKPLGEALVLLNKATAEIQQILATSHL